MDRKAIEQLKTKPAEELKKMLAEHTEKMWSLKESILNGKVKNVKEMRDLKKDIARLMTFLKQNTK